MKLFAFKDGKLVIDRVEVLHYPALAAIIQRDKGSTGDSEGRQKLQAFKELMYVFQVCDYASYPNQHGLDDIDKHKHAIDIARLPDDWLPDGVILAALDFYTEYNQSIPKEVAKELLASFNNSTKVIKRLRHETSNLLNKTSLTSVEVGQLTDMQRTLINIASDLPKHLKALKEIEDLIKKEEAQGVVARGGSIVKNSQNPDTAIG